MKRARHIVVTCGTSIERSLCWKGSPLSADSSPDRLTDPAWKVRIASFKDEIEKRWSPADGAAGGDIRRDRAAELLALFDHDCWRLSARHLMSAELSTLLLVDQEEPLEERDTIEFIYGTSTPVPVRVLAHLFNPAPIGRDPSGGHAFALDPPVRSIDLRYGHPTVLATGIDGLDARDSAAYAAALDHVGDALFESRPRDLEQRRIFLLTGGFKGTVARVMLRAFQEHAADPDGVRALYVHTDSDRLIDLPLATGGGVSPRRGPLHRRDRP